MVLKRNLKAVLFGALLVSQVGLCAANENAQLRNLENRVTALEQKKGMGNLINPPAGPRVRNGADLYLTGDVLIWQAQTNGTPLAVNFNGEGGAHADVVNINNRWNAGFRVGVGYNLPHDGWDVGLTWLRYYTGGKGSANVSLKDYGFGPVSGSGDYLLASQAIAALGTGLDFSPDNGAMTAFGNYKLHLNQLDLELGRNFFVSKWLALRPHFGLRNEWIWQRWNMNYSLLDEADSYTRYDRSNTRVRYWGLGPCTGLDTQWGLGSGFSIYGNGSFAILYGLFKRDRFDRVLIEKGTEIGLPVHASNHICRLIADLELGLRWDEMFCQDQFHFQIQAGWEQHLYLGMNQNPTPLASSDDYGKYYQNQGDLSLQGWTLSMRFDF